MEIQYAYISVKGWDTGIVQALRLNVFSLSTVEVRGLGEHPHLHQRINQRRWELLADWSSWLKGSAAATSGGPEKNLKTQVDGLSWKASLYLW